MGVFADKPSEDKAVMIPLRVGAGSEGFGNGPRLACVRSHRSRGPSLCHVSPPCAPESTISRAADCCRAVGVSCREIGHCPPKEGGITPPDDGDWELQEPLRACAMSASIDKHGFSAAEREAVYRAIAERRDMRHFVPEPVAPEVLVRLLEAAHHAPSVGLTQPWRFLRITDASLRQRIHRLVEEERRHTAEALGRRQDEFLRLKVEGIAECGELLVVALTDGRERQVFGRRTLACAIQNLWLAARAEGLGMGWVSMFDPQAFSRLLGMPEGTKPISILCLGHVPAYLPSPCWSLTPGPRGAR